MSVPDGPFAMMDAQIERCLVDLRGGKTVKPHALLDVRPLLDRCRAEGIRVRTSVVRERSAFARDAGRKARMVRIEPEPTQMSDLP